MSLCGWASGRHEVTLPSVVFSEVCGGCTDGLKAPSFRGVFGSGFGDFWGFLRFAGGGCVGVLLLDMVRCCLRWYFLRFPSFAEIVRMGRNPVPFRMSSLASSRVSKASHVCGGSH